MKNKIKPILLTFFLSLTIFSFGQTWGKFNYQAIIRDGNGVSIKNQNVNIRFQIFDAIAAGALVYQEDFPNINTGGYGVVNLQIGTNGSIPLKSLNWNTKSYFVNIQMGSPYSDISPNRTPLVSVPYSFFALSSIKSDTAKYAIATSSPTLNLTGSGITTVNGTYPNYAISSTEVDGSISNELQTLSNNPGNVISLSQSGGSVTLNFTVSNNQLQLNGKDVLPLTSLIPPGTIMAFGGTTIPDGWLLCDGGSYSTSSTAKEYQLFKAIGYNFGGSGGNFNLPDFRGRFLRGVSGSTDNDPDKSNRAASASGGNTGNNVGSYQFDVFQGHWHGAFLSSSNGTPGGGLPDINAYNKDSNKRNDIINGSDAITDGSNDTPRVSKETRPKNVNVNYIIKY